MLFTVLKKESKQLLSDKGFILIALIQPIILIIMFGSSFSGGDINHLKTAVIDLDNTTFSGYVVSAINSSEFFSIVSLNNPLEKDLERLNKSELRSVIVIPKGFQKSINNKSTGEIKIYLDSSNFLTYKSLSSAKIGIAKNSLQNITEDILGNIESEKEHGKEKIDRLKKIFKDVETDADSLDLELNKLRSESENSNITELKNLVTRIKDSLNELDNSLNQSIYAFDQLIDSLQSLKTVNQTEEAKKLIIISQISSINSGFSDSRNGIADLKDQINNIGIPDANKVNTQEIEKKLESIKNSFNKADNLSKNINFNFNMLDKNFLSEPITINETAIYGDLRYFDYLSAGVLSLIIFFVCLMAPALNIIYEKEENTLYRLSTTPASSFTIFFGKFILFMVFGFVELVYTFSLAILLYGMRISGSIYDSLLILGLLASSSISLGLFISSRVKTLQQALVIVPVIVIPSFLISNAFFPPDIMAPYMKYVSYITPMTYSNHALNAIMIKGMAIKDVLTDIYALLGFTIIPLVLFIWSYIRIKY